MPGELLVEKNRAQYLVILNVLRAGGIGLLLAAVRSCCFGSIFLGTQLVRFFQMLQMSFVRWRRLHTL